MNYLAHITLSGDDPNFLFGNFIGDIIPFKNIALLDKKVRYGVELHQYIDRITDAHEATKRTVQLFKMDHGLYGPVIVDIAFDHFLFRNWDKYVEEDYGLFCDRKYPQIQSYYSAYQELLPDFVQSMIDSKWLNIYRSIDGLGKVYNSMKRRVSKPEYFDHCIRTIKNNNEKIEENFNELFPFLLEKSREKREEIILQNGRKA